MGNYKFPKYLEKGMRFGRWTVDSVYMSSKIKKDGTKQKPSQWKYHCICDCGNKGTPIKNGLVRGYTTSCGCFRDEKLSNRRSITNKIEECGDIIKVFFNNVAEGDVHDHTIVDKDDYDKIKDFGWFRKKSHKTFYAYANSKGNFGKTKVYMHQILLECEDGLEPDHINRDGLDNRVANLRKTTKYGNSDNRGKYKNNVSGHTGVLRSNGKWEARISIYGNRKVLGVFDSFEEAVKARKNAEQEKIRIYKKSNEY